PHVPRAQSGLTRRALHPAARAARPRRAPARQGSRIPRPRGASCGARSPRTTPSGAAGRVEPETAVRRLPGGAGSVSVFLELPLRKSRQANGVCALCAQRGLLVPDLVSARPDVETAAGGLPFDAFTARIAFEYGFRMLSSR